MTITIDGFGAALVLIGLVMMIIGTQRTKK
jgi:hypothetical protein